MPANANGQKKWWFITPLIAVASLVFGAGGMAYSTCDRIAMHDKSIESLTAKAAQLDIVYARIDERLKAIDSVLRRIETKIENNP